MAFCTEVAERKTHQICVPAERSRVAVRGLLAVSVLNIGLELREFKPGRGRWSSNGDKNLQYDFLRRGTKAVGSMLYYFTAC
jgi:hypothetical protein